MKREEGQKVDKNSFLFEIVDGGDFGSLVTYFYISEEKVISCFQRDAFQFGECSEELQICRIGRKPALFDRCIEWLRTYLSDEAHLVELAEGEPYSAAVIYSFCVDDEDIENTITDRAAMRLPFPRPKQNTFAAGDIPLILAYLLPEEQRPWPLSDYLSEQGIAPGEVPERTKALLDRA